MFLCLDLTSLLLHGAQRFKGKCTIVHVPWVPACRRNVKPFYEKKRYIHNTCASKSCMYITVMRVKPVKTLTSLSSHFNSFLTWKSAVHWSSNIFNLYNIGRNKEGMWNYVDCGKIPNYIHKIQHKTQYVKVSKVQKNYLRWNVPFHLFIVVLATAMNKLCTVEIDKNPPWLTDWPYAYYVHLWKHTKGFSIKNLSPFFTKIVPIPWEYINF